MEALRYPIGRFDVSRQKESTEWHIWMLGVIPDLLRDAISGMTSEQLDTPYRSGGWTIRQIVHHFADSHMNGYARFKQALTEDQPTISPYNQDRWVELSSEIPMETSLDLLDSLHQCWVNLLHTMRPEHFQKGYVHPEEGFLSLDTALRLYSWHGRHHLAQITSFRERMNI
ncbi:YfiT family bacillithiol transferase [Melghirimyces algeriensis]|uniref:DinB superfamily protein n=1 Tax=Melghirimyces algeriensis TaxID=910412 RepID=A0A521CIR7_9BACL|nr:putative metal-dependent hydrolase [Melghirimyces algeriensis]SMO59324.1 DinB superfamily protein [Melghirimyces algeriensis]